MVVVLAVATPLSLSLSLSLALLYVFWKRASTRVRAPLVSGSQLCTVARTGEQGMLAGCSEHKLLEYLLLGVNSWRPF